MKMTFISRHLMRRPNNSIGYLEELKIRSKTELKTKDILQVGNSKIHYPIPHDYLDFWKPLHPFL